MRALLHTGLALAGALLLAPVLLVEPACAWGHDGHMMINRLASASLPADVPEFLRSPAAQDAMDFYGPVPDEQWRSYAVPELSKAMSPEHFIDLELTTVVGDLPNTRYQFLAALAAAQASHPDMQLSPERIGLLPYAIEERYERLQAAMHTYRELLAAKRDTRAVEAEIVFTAGILGHFVGDGSQPMHTSIEYNGWTGPNPNGYTTSTKVHTEFEGDFVHDNIKLADFSRRVPAAPAVVSDLFAETLRYLRQTGSNIEKTYQLEKTGAFSGAGTPAGKDFVDQQLAVAAAELRDMIYTAWVKSAAPVPPYHGN